VVDGAGLGFGERGHKGAQTVVVAGVGGGAKIFLKSRKAAKSRARFGVCGRAHQALRRGRVRDTDLPKTDTLAADRTSNIAVVSKAKPVVSSGFHEEPVGGPCRLPVRKVARNLKQ